jgi:hypothetical protein
MGEKIDYIRNFAINEFACVDMAIKAYKDGNFKEKETLKMINKKRLAYEERSKKFGYDRSMDGSNPADIKKFNSCVNDYNQLVERNELTIEKAEKITSDFFAYMRKK